MVLKEKIQKAIEGHSLLEIKKVLADLYFENEEKIQKWNNAEDAKWN